MNDFIVSLHSGREQSCYLSSEACPSQCYLDGLADLALTCGVEAVKTKRFFKRV